MNHSDDNKTFEASFEAYLSRLQTQTDNKKNDTNVIMMLHAQHVKIVSQRNRELGG